MKLRFDANLQYQQQAISAVVDLFSGQTPKQSLFTVQTYSTPVTETQTSMLEHADVDGYIHVKDGHREPPRTHRRRDTGKSPGGASCETDCLRRKL